MSVMLIDSDKSGELIEGICQFSQMWNCRRFLDSTDTGKLYHSNVAKFINSLFRANLQTWNKRYDEQDTIPDITFTTGKPMNKYQTLKTLECLHYNIELEYVPLAKKLIEQLEIMINEIKNNIIEEMDEYKSAKWG